MREFEFRAWVDDFNYYTYDIQEREDMFKWFGHPTIHIEQYTGLKDKNGKEIYENCELDGRYRVEYIAPKFVGKDIIKGDIIELYDNKFTITKEHCEISQNSERSIN